jgi:hypothetical protein
MKGSEIRKLFVGNNKMKRLISYLTLLVFFIGCVTPQSVSKSDSDMKQIIALQQSVHENMLLKDVQKLSDKLDYCILNNSPLIDFWDKMILIPLEEYLTYDSSWNEYLTQKEQEYINSLIPNCKKELLDAFERIGIKPKQQDYNMLRVEFILTCLDNPKREIIRAEVFKHLTNKIDSFFLPIYDKVKHDVCQEYDRLDRAIKGLAESDRWANHSIIQAYYIDEITKLRIRYALDKKYTPIIESELKRFLDSLSENQRQMYSLISKGDSTAPKKLLKSLSPEQYLLLERAIFKTSFIQSERKIGKDRGEKLNKLAAWLDENKAKLEAMERESAQKRAEYASSIILGILSIVGVAAITLCALAGYNSWRNVYYAPYQTPQVKTFNPRLCGRFARRSAKMVLGSQPTEFNLDKFPLL